MCIHVWVFNFVQSSCMFLCWFIFVIIIIEVWHGNPSSIAFFFAVILGFFFF